MRAHIHEKRRRGHAESLMPMVQGLMSEAALSYADLDLIAATVGPGTFTGLRIGLAAARGIALASGRPIIGITTLEALAFSIPIEKALDMPVVATADARRGEIYMQAFMRTETAAGITPLMEPVAAPLSVAYELLPPDGGILVGSGVPLLQELAGFDPLKYIPLELDDDPDALFIAALAEARGLPPADSEPPSPLYLRAPDAKLPGGIVPNFELGEEN